MNRLLTDLVVVLTCSTLVLSGCGSGISEMAGVTPNDQSAATHASPFEFKALDPLSVEQLTVALAAQPEGRVDEPLGVEVPATPTDQRDFVLSGGTLSPGSVEFEDSTDASSAVREKAPVPGCTAVTRVPLSNIKPGVHNAAWSSIKARHRATGGDLYRFSAPPSGWYLPAARVKGTVTLDDATQTITLRQTHTGVSCEQYEPAHRKGETGAKILNTTWREYVAATVGTTVSVTITAAATIAAFATTGGTAIAIAAVASCLGGVAGTFITSAIAETPIDKRTVAQAATSCVVNAGGSVIGRGSAYGLTKLVEGLKGWIAIYIPGIVESIELTTQGIPRAS